MSIMKVKITIVFTFANKEFPHNSTIGDFS